MILTLYYAPTRPYTHRSQLRSNWWRCYVRNSVALAARILWLTITCDWWRCYVRFYCNNNKYYCKI